ncbi:MAG: DUF3786 domain-containing protein [Deltaproteobacteria bacterium]|nr:DUF3786 domain-containing protein [Deltaproteobacteria bacterium]
MSDELLKIQREYIRRRYDQLPEDMDQRLLAIREKDSFHFKAFGQPCTVSPDGITLGGVPITGPIGVLIALYVFHAVRDPVQIEPVKSFKQIKGTTPYHGAFSARSEKSLIPYVTGIRQNKETLLSVFDGKESEGTKGDSSFILYPLPKVPLQYIFYLADEEFPASVTCLLASNAELFMPVDGLADVGEYTAKRIVEIVTR